MSDVIDEEMVAHRLGVTRERIKEVRVGHLIEGEDFERKRNRFLWSPDGVKKARGVLAGASGEEIASPGQAGAAVDEKNGAVVVEATVVKATFKNRLIITANLASGAEVRVRVHSAEKFVPGMPVRIRHVEDDLYDLEGRGPRARGVW